MSLKTALNESIIKKYSSISFIYRPNTCILNIHNLKKNKIEVRHALKTGKITYITVTLMITL